MKILGPQVSLLLTGVLPLLAQDDVPAIGKRGEEQEYQKKLQNAAEEMHDDALTSIPSLQLLDLSSASATKIVMAESRFGENLSLDMNMGKRIDQQYCNITPAEIEESLDPLNKSDAGVPDDKDDKSAAQENRNEERNEEGATAEPSVIDEVAIDVNGGERSQENIEAEEEEEVVSEPVNVDYASKSAGALILESSPSMKGASNLLHSDKDKYAITPCTDKKFVVLGLSEDILVKQIKIANYERYSSHVKGFQVLGSQTMGQWVDLGTFEAANQGNGEQAFELEEPSWARYLKFKFTTHYGGEHYCTLSQLGVHGSTMQQGFHEDWNESEEEKKDAGIIESVAVPKSKTEEAETPYATEDGKKQRDVDEVVNDSSSDEAADDAADGAPETNEIEVSPPEVIIRKVKEQAFNTKPDVKYSEVKLPRPLPPIFDIHAALIPNALARTLFELPVHKHKFDMYRPPRIEVLNTAAICPAPRRDDFDREIRDAVKVVSENLDKAQKIDYASTVSNAVRELQSRIQTTLGKTWDLQHTIQTMIGNALPDLDLSWDEATSSEKAQESEESASASTEPTPSAEKVESKPEPEIATEEQPSVVDDSVLDTEMPVGLAEVVAQYQSANCLEALHFPAFKKNIMDKLATAGGATGSPTGKMEPVFKTLTVEIKALQISQNVHDQFSRALVTCYQSILIEMASELHETKNLQDDRLSKLEAELRQMKSNNWVSSVDSSAVYWMSLCFSLSVVFFTQSCLLIKETVTQILALEDGPYILGAIGLALTITMFLLLRALRRRSPPKLAAATASIDSVAVLRHDFISSSTMNHHSRNNNRITIPRCRSLQLFPSE